MQRARSPSIVDLAVVGGGFTGAATAIHALRREPALRVAVIEPRATLGAGVAYDTQDPAHRINVPAARMFAVVGEEAHFTRWLLKRGWPACDPGCQRTDGAIFVARAVFGRYVAETLAAAGPVRHLRARAERIAPSGPGFAVETDAGETIEARTVVLAVTHPPPAVPPALAPLLGHPALTADLFAEGLPPIAADARLLVVGTGLTMADAVATLASRGHAGPITAVSRRGVLSRGHALEPGAAEWPPLTPLPTTALALLRAIRAAVAAAARAGRPWQAVFDSVRVQAPALWEALPEAERRRVVARLRPFWDVHRFRIAPQPEAAIAEARARGQLQVRAAHLRSATATGDAIAVRFASRREGEWAATFDRVILATGPAHAGAVTGNPAFASLHAAGLLRPDACGLGLDVDVSSRALDRDGRPVAGLFVAGPLARGRFGELMGLPEVTRHAALVAEHAVAALHPPALAA